MVCATTLPPPLGESPAYLVAAAYAAHRSGDAELERVVLRRLIRDFGIRLIFERTQLPSANALHGGQA